MRRSRHHAFARSTVNLTETQASSFADSFGGEKGSNAFEMMSSGFPPTVSVTDAWPVATRMSRGIAVVQMGVLGLDGQVAALGHSVAR